MSDAIDPFSGNEVKRTITAIESPFALRLRQCRTEAGWTQEQAAKQLKVSRAQLTNIECGKKPSLDLFVRMCNVYDVSADWLLWGD